MSTKMARAVEKGKAAAYIGEVMKEVQECVCDGALQSKIRTGAGS